MGSRSDNHKNYHDLYDRLTVESARRGIVHYDRFFNDIKSKLKPGDKLDRPGNAIVLNVFYMAVVGDELIRRYNQRESTIREWVERDEAKDQKILAARLSSEPVCQHCGKTGLRITSKGLMHRREDAGYDDPEDVLFMLDCPACGKRSGVWEDGMTWKPQPSRCEKCRKVVDMKSRKSKQRLTFSYTCRSCGHNYRDVMELGDEEEKPDPEFEADRQHYCLLEDEFRERLFAMKRDFEEMARLGKEFKERQDHKEVYEAVKRIKKPKIAELSTLLSGPLEKKGYVEFRLEPPEMGKDVYVGFSCLDSKSERGDYDSRKELKKIIESLLKETNWRLMSDGIHHRLGYLSGRVRAYEHEEDLKDLLQKEGVKKTKSRSSQSKKDNQWRIKGKDGEDILL
jgi:hypothetical protein